MYDEPQPQRMIQHQSLAVLCDIYPFKLQPLESPTFISRRIDVTPLRWTTEERQYDTWIDEKNPLLLEFLPTTQKECGHQVRTRQTKSAQ